MSAEVTVEFVDTNPVSVDIKDIRPFTAVCTKLVVANCVVFVPAVAVGAVGTHVNAGLDKGAPPISVNTVDGDSVITVLSAFTFIKEVALGSAKVARCNPVVVKFGSLLCKIYQWFPTAACVPPAFASFDIIISPV